MKKEIHPESYRLVAFKDMSNDDIFITKSTVETKETIEVDGVEYPLVKLEISRTSHPYYTGKSKLIDTAGRIDKILKRWKYYYKWWNIIYRRKWSRRFKRCCRSILCWSWRNNNK